MKLFQEALHCVWKLKSYIVHVIKIEKAVSLSYRAQGCLKIQQSLILLNYKQQRK